MVIIIDIAEHLKLALPVRPKNVGELRLVRFWLRQLSRVHFEQTECNPDPYSTNVPCLNPAFVNALFPTEVIAVPSFGEVDVWLKEEMLPGLATFAQIDTLRCRLWKGPWYQEDYDPTTHFIDFILASKYRMNSVLIKSHRINGELTFTEELRLIEVVVDFITHL